MTLQKNAKKILKKVEEYKKRETTKNERCDT